MGLAASVAMTRVLQTMLFGVTPTDLPTLGAVAGVLGIVAIAAAYVPARRAARVDAARTLNVT